MLEITVPEQELFNEATNEFYTVKSQTLKLEHSLVSISKWESKWKVPFLSKGKKTREQTIDYIRCMTITQNVNPLVYMGITNTNIQSITEYIDDSMTATWFSEPKNSTGQKEIVTSELIYYWMIALNIPMECQRWHLNRLLTLIKICNIKNQKPKKMSKSEIYSRNRALNAARRQRINSRG